MLPSLSILKYFQEKFLINIVCKKLNIFLLLRIQCVSVDTRSIYHILKGKPANSK